MAFEIAYAPGDEGFPQTRTYTVKSGSTCYRGDVVVIDGTTGHVSAGSTNGTFAGVVTACYDTNGIPSLSAPAGGTVDVAVDPNIVLKTTASGSVDASNIGDACDLTGSGGSSTTGLSSQTVTLTVTNSDFTIVDIDSDNPGGTSTGVLVKFGSGNHAFAQ